MNQPNDFFTTAELNPHNFPTTPEIDANLDELHDRLNQLRTAYNKPLVLTSCLRSEALQQKLIEEGKSTAFASKHLIGAAADIADSDGKVHAFLQSNPELVEKIGLWMENRQGPWQHVQIMPPKSGKRWFNP